METITLTGFLREVIIFHYLPEVIRYIHIEMGKPSDTNTTELTAQSPVRKEVPAVAPL